MCGITGITRLPVDSANGLEPVLETMVSSLTHRGPDGQGIQWIEGVGIGHRRLAIIDPIGGHQPFSNEDGLVWITYNGELYNFKEIRSNLIARGHQFRTNSDTEVIVHAYDEYGEHCVEYFRGMFAFCIVDLKQRLLFLACDQLGIKPLYYLAGDNLFAFASEIQTLRKIPGQSFTLDLSAVDQYLSLQYIPAPETIFKEVRKLPPAHRFIVTFDGVVHNPVAYWEFEFRPNYDRPETEWLDLLDERLRESVQAHLVSDVPFGAFLSGGMDSSAVIAYMTKILDKPVKTFTIGFDEPDFDETSYAQQASNYYHTDHYVEIVHPDALEILPDLVRHYGEPFGDISAIPTYYVSRLARRYVPMVLTGDGGDEAFAGYNSYKTWMAWLNYDEITTAQEKMKVWKRPLYPFARWLFPSRYPTPSKRLPSLSNWLPFIEQYNAGTRQELWRKDYQHVVQNRHECLEAAFAKAQTYQPTSLAQFLDIKTYLPFDILTKVDIASMLHGLEARTPFVDIRVMELAATIPQEMNITCIKNNEWIGKRLFKKLLERYYPASFLDRPKMGFNVPFSIWFRKGTQNQDLLFERFFKNGSELEDFFEPSVIKNLLEKKGLSRLWLLMFLDEWLKQNQCINTP